MPWNSARRLIIAAIVLGASCVPVAAQSASPVRSNDEDHSIIYELGWAGSYSRAEGIHARGATFAFEVTPIPDRLELECGVTAIRASGATETSVDLLFKKPWSLSRHIEFMIGLGPEIIHATGAEAGTFWGISAVVDFMFWPSKNVGWYLEPGYDATFRNGVMRHGFAMTGGLLIGR
jgi:hypothetical protein